MDRAKRKTLKAFTLLELMVVIAIIGILTAIIVPNTAEYLRDAKQTAENDQAQQLYMAVQDYLIDMQIRGDKASDYFGIDNVGGLGGLTDLTAGTSDPDLRIMGNGVTEENAKWAAKEIRDRLSGDFQGAWVVLVYPKTYTVAGVYFCDQAGTGERFDWEAVKFCYDNVISSSPFDPKYFSSRYGDQGSQEYAVKFSQNKDGQYIGQYPIS